MVWMGDMLLQNESNDLMMEQGVDPGFFVDASSQSLGEEDIRCRNQMGMEGFMMLEDLDDSRWYVNGMPEEMMLDGDPTNSNKVVNTSTQTGLQNAPPGSRKIKPVKHPGLKLQTPIAYQRDTDLNVIPIQKEGRAVCKKCGAIGVKHAFYTRERRYCSLACARGSDDHEMGNQEIDQSPTNSQWSPEEAPPVLAPVPPPVSISVPDNQPPQLIQQTAPFTGTTATPVSYVAPQPTPQPAPLPQQNLTETQLPPVFILPPDEPPFPAEKKIPSLLYSYDWSVQLTDPYFKAAPTSCFKHAPMADLWHYIDVGLKVEVENTDSYDFCEEFPNSFWIASVLRVEGYKALLRYEGFISDGSKDFWVNLCSSSVHPVGWCAIRGKPLIPPKSIKDKYSNWKEFLKRRLTGARTLPSNFYSKVHDSMKSRFRCDLTVEVVDKHRISQVKVATIDKIVGKRLQLRYYDSNPKAADVFWCHEDSPIIHPVGWAKRIGQRLDCSPEYQDRIMKGLREKDDSTADLFVLPERFPLPENLYFRKGMKLEAIDPLNLADICVATIMEVLNEGYLLICVDFWNDQHPSTEDWFCYHMTSPCIFPAGFCASNDIALMPPKDYNRTTFDWNRYLQETGCIAAPAQLFNQDVPDHGFEVGMKLESADLMNPRLVCVATIIRVVGRLLKVHFDGWEKEFDQWLDCNSCDIYPVGWCELVSHKLEPPFSESKPAACGNRGGSRKRRGKTGTGGSPTKAESLKIASRAEEFENNVPDNETETFALENSNDSAIETKSKKSHRQEWVTNAQTSSPQNVSPSTAKNLKSTILVEQNNCTPDKNKIIPRLSDCKSKSISVRPDTWGVEDVAEFLKINDCATYCDAFIKKGIDGRKLLELSKEEVLSLAGMKVGPSLKIQNLINQLTMKVNPAQRRNKPSLKTVL